jgi:hypothetical protein
MRDRAWIIAQFAVAGLLLAISLLGIIGLVAFDMAELSFSFAGGIQAFAVFPGLVLSLTVNALLMRTHRAVGLNTAEKVLLIIEGALIAALLLFHFYTDPAGTTFGLAIITWPIVILLAIAIAIVAAARSVSARQNPPPDPPAPPSPASITPTP